jgi:DNA-directed RNA polymerase beta' subunit
MSKICTHCGAEMDDEAYECPECLEKIPGADAIKRRREAEKKEKRTKKLKIAGGMLAAVAFITGLTLLVSVFTRKPSYYYMKPVRDYISGCVANEYDQHISAFPELFQRIMSEQYAYIVLNQMSDALENPEKVHTADLLYFDQYYRELMRVYGTDFNITYKIYKEKHFNDEELKKYQNEYISLSPEDLADVVFEDGYSLALTFTIKGNLGSKTINEENFNLFKINGKWCMMSYIDFFAEKELTNIQNMQ